jgi:homoserine O-succinyltransferase
MSEPIRACLAVVNLMPQAEVYLDYLGALLPPQTSVRWIRVRNHPYKSSDQATLEATHRFFSDVDLEDCDALLVSGSPLDRPEFALERATYWNELVTELRQASERVGSIGGICWGAFALAKIFYGLEKRVFPRKLHGVFEVQRVTSQHELARGLDDRYGCPQSRYGQIDPEGVEQLSRSGELVPLDWSAATGHCSIASRDGGLLFMQGHPDYPTERLCEEYKRAQSRGEALHPPENYDLERPTNTWRANSRALFDSWLRLAQARRRARSRCN